MRERLVYRYSECFKQEVVEALEAGRFDSFEAAGVHYGVRGNGTIARWLKGFGKSHLQAKMVRVEKPDEADRIRELQKQIAKLERALGQTQAENLLNAELLKTACRRLGEDVEGFKEKKERWGAVHRVAQASGGQADIKALCQAAGMSRQNYYWQRRVRQQAQVDESLVCQLVRAERQRQPRLAGRKLWRLLR